jgi:hypothetical protein
MRKKAGEDTDKKVITKYLQKRGGKKNKLGGEEQISTFSR